MNQRLLDNRVVTQIGLVVHDIDKTAEAYAQFFGIDKPKVMVTDPLEQARTEYRGQPTVARAKLAFIDMGAVQIELIEPDEHSSTWRESLDKHGEGVHHIAFQVQGMREKISLFERSGMPLLQKGEYTGGRYAYMDTEAALKVIVELLEND